ncbi:uncharacterized protein LOC116262258 isoform X2 [Nymphaea colorata]|uniref:uncharacterized protein LOC116262258 isoform X2 n=1 Tax=Nymphaea colorata TaxID=210225 RepID=UPI00129DFBB4|nr:uncharacterized protein LOC116262258 isoform X2 [Nymphaea colorata]
MVRSRVSLSKKPKGVDFKKVRRKIGRKLPPPNNATNTQIKSKAIVLPEQSLASNKEGLLLNSKGKSLTELLMQTKHFNRKNRTDALMGLRDLSLHHLGELKLHTAVIVETLSLLISDPDKGVREMLHSFLLTIFRGLKEDIKTPIISRMMLHIFNAMTHLQPDIRLMALKFLDLIVQHYPSSICLHIDKVLDNYIGILNNHHIFLEYSSKLKDTLDVLVSCLASLTSQKQKAQPSYEQEASKKGVLHAYLDSFPPTNTDKAFSTIYSKLQKLVLILVSYWKECIQLVNSELRTNGKEFDCLHYMLQTVNLSVKLVVGDQTSIRDSILSLDKGAAGKSCNLPELLEEVFGPCFSAIKDGEKEFILKAGIAEIFLRLNKWMDFNQDSLAGFLGFMEDSLCGKVGGSMQPFKLVEKYLISCIYLIPDLVTKVTHDRACRLLQAFTSTFKGCRSKSELKLACLSSMKQIFGSGQDMLFADLGREILKIWVQALPRLLLDLGQEHPASSEVVLRFYLHILQCECMNYSIYLACFSGEDIEPFYSCGQAEGGECGPFMKLPRVCQEIAVCCLYYMPKLSRSLLEALAQCCQCHDLEATLVLKVINVVHSSYQAGHVSIEDHISFLISVILCYQVGSAKDFSTMGICKERDTYFRNYRVIVRAVCSCLSDMGDGDLIFRILQPVILRQLKSDLPIDKKCAVIRMILVLNSRLENLPEDIVDELGHWLSEYLIKAAAIALENESGAGQADWRRNDMYYIIPCIYLLHQSWKLFSVVLESFLRSHEYSSSTLSSQTSQIQCINYILSHMNGFKIFQRHSLSCEALIMGIMEKFRKAREPLRESRCIT